MHHFLQMLHIKSLTGKVKVTPRGLYGSSRFLVIQFIYINIIWIRVESLFLATGGSGFLILEEIDNNNHHRRRMYVLSRDGECELCVTKVWGNDMYCCNFCSKCCCYNNALMELVLWNELSRKIGNHVSITSYYVLLVLRAIAPL